MKFKEIFELTANKGMSEDMSQELNRERDLFKAKLKHRAPKIRFLSADDDSLPPDNPSGRYSESLIDAGVSQVQCDERATAPWQMSERTAVQRRIDPALTEEVISTDPRFIGRVFSVEVQDVRLPDGRQSKREVVRHPGGACVVALDEEQCLLLVRQHRVGTGGTTREIPAGKLDVPEDPLDCARRELAEETSVIAERWDLLTRYYPSPGYTDEVISIYLARGLSKVFARPDDGEFLSVERIHLTEALSQIREGLITDGKTCLGILMAADYIGYFSR